MRILRISDPGAGGNPPAAPTLSQPQGDTPPAPSSSPAAGAAPSPPPAATAVLNSDVTEADAAEMVKTKRENEELRGKLKDRETRVNELEDENRQLKNIPTAPPPKKKNAGNWTLFED